MMEFNDSDLRILSYGLYLAKKTPSNLDIDKINEIYNRISEKLDGKKLLYISRKDAGKLVDILQSNLNSGDSEMDKEDIEYCVKVLTNNAV